MADITMLMLAWGLVPVVGVGHSGALAFVAQTSPLMRKARPTPRTSLSYKTADRIEKERVAPASPLGDTAPEDITSTADAPISAASDDTSAEGGDAATVEGEDDWLSATRNLGSLFLRQEDADRDKNVDVFGRPLLVGNETGDGNATSPFANLQDNSFAQYLLNLKFEEEDNRERAAENADKSPRVDAAEEGGTGKDDKSKFQIDQVRYFAAVSVGTYFDRGLVLIRSMFCR